MQNIAAYTLYKTIIRDEFHEEDVEIATFSTLEDAKQLQEELEAEAGLKHKSFSDEWFIDNEWIFTYWIKDNCMNVFDSIEEYESIYSSKERTA